MSGSRVLGAGGSWQRRPGEYQRQAHAEAQTWADNMAESVCSETGQNWLRARLRYSSQSLYSTPISL